MDICIKLFHNIKNHPNVHDIYANNALLIVFYKNICNAFNFIKHDNNGIEIHFILKANNP